MFSKRGFLNVLRAPHQMSLTRDFAFVRQLTPFRELRTARCQHKLGNAVFLFAPVSCRSAQSRRSEQEALNPSALAFIHGFYQVDHWSQRVDEAPCLTNAS